MNSLLLSGLRRRLVGLLLLLGLLLALRPAARGQSANDVRVTVLVLPPYSTHLSDYVDQPNRLVVTLTNQTSSALSLQLAGTLTGDNGVRVQTRPQARSPRAVQLAARQSRTLDRDELGQLFDESQLSYTGISAEQVVRGNGLPEGTYTLCVRALDYATQQPRSAENPLGCSRAFMLRSLEPPMVVRPLADEVIKIQSPQNILFTWTRPAGAALSTEYELRIVELSNNQRNPNDAFLAGTVPPLFERTVSPATTLLYGPAEPALIPGRRYAFAVTARDPQDRSVFRNNGRSEVRTFVYGAGAAATSPVVVGPTKQVRKTDLTPVRTTYQAVPKSVIRGQVRWAFRATEKSSLLALLDNVKLGGYSPTDPGVVAALTDPTYGPTAALAIAKGNPSSPAGGSPGVNGTGGSPGVGGTGNPFLEPTSSSTSTSSGPKAGVLGFGGGSVSGGSGLGAVVLGGGALDGVLQGGIKTSPPANSQNTPIPIGTGDGAAKLKLQYFMGPERFPLNGVKIRLVVVKRPIPPGKPGYNDPMLNAEHLYVVGKGTTNAEGRFSISFINPCLLDDPTGAKGPALKVDQTTLDFSRVRLEVDDPRFMAETATYDLISDKAGSYDLAEPADCLARSFRLNAQVKWAYSTKEVPGPVHVRLYRLVDFYGSHSYARPEGTEDPDQRPVKMIKAGAAVLVGSALAGKDAGRLLLSDGSPTDQYVVVLEAEGFTTKEVPLQVLAPAPNPNEGVLTIKQSYLLYATPPSLVAQVIRSHDGSAVVGASVRLQKGPESKPTQVVTTVTDDQGRFVLADLPQGNASWTLLVTGAELTQPYRRADLQLPAPGPQSRVDLGLIKVDVTQYPVAGRVLADDDSQPLAGAQLRWKSGGPPFTTAANGTFLTNHQAGPDSLVVSKLGFREKHVYLNVKSAPVLGLGTPGGNAKAMETFLKNLDLGGELVQGLGELNGPPVGPDPGNPGGKSLKKLKGADGSKIDFTTNSVAALLQNGGFSPGLPIGEGLSAGDIRLPRLVGRLLVTVQDSASGKALSGAQVSILNAAPALGQATGGSGEAYFAKAPGGPVTVRVTGPADAAGPAYVPAQASITVSTAGDVTKLLVKLAPGARLTGLVAGADGKPVSGATVRVVGRDDLLATTNAAGQYELVAVPRGYWEVKAAKSGFVGQQQGQGFKAAPATLNFTLKGAGFDVSKLLGFPIEVDKLETGADTLLTGAFVQLPGNAVFKPGATARLAFTKQKITVGKGGLVRPKGAAYVLTDEAALSLTAFGFLPVTLSQQTGLKVEMDGANPARGTISGTAMLDLPALVGKATGWEVPKAAKEMVLGLTGDAKEPLQMLTSDGKLPYATEKLTLGGEAQELKVYGLTVSLNLPKSTVGLDGLHLAGSLSLKDVPGLSAAKVTLKELWISPAAAVKKADLDFTEKPTLQLGDWGLSLLGGGFTEAGLNLSGDLKFQLPATDPTSISFTDLKIGSGQLFGGIFKLNQPLNLYKVAALKTGDQGLAFGTLPGGKYYVSGGATLTLPDLDKTLTVQEFNVQSGGQFQVTVPADFSVGFKGLLDMKVKGLGFSNLNGKPSVDMKSDVTLKLPLNIKASASGLHFRPGEATGVDKFDVYVPLAGFGGLGGGIGYADNLFSADLDLALTAFTAKAKFAYGKKAAGTYFHVDMLASTPPILIGPALTLTKLGGSLEYTGGSITEIGVKGTISVAGADAALALDPAELKIKAGPVFEGNAPLKAATYNLAGAAFTIDFPKKYVGVNVHVDYEPFPMVTAHGEAVAAVSAAASDTYWLLGVSANANMFKLLDGTVNVAAAWNMNRAKHPEWNTYTSFIQPAYLSGGNTLNGVYMRYGTHIGRHKEDALCGDIYIAEGCVWYYADSDVSMDLNFKSNSYRMELANKWGGGLDVSVAGFSIASGDVGAEGNVSGGHDSEWWFKGDVGAHVNGSVGNCDPDECNSVCMCGYSIFSVPCGLMICGSTTLKVSYRKSAGGVKVDYDF